MIETQTYIRKPVPVRAIQVSEENMRDIARWCRGTIETAPKRGDKPARRFIQVPVLRALSDRQTKAYVSDWVLFMEGSGFKVFTDKAFRDAYESEKSEDVGIEEVKEGIYEAVDEFIDRVRKLV